MVLLMKFAGKEVSCVIRGSSLPPGRVQALVILRRGYASQKLIKGESITPNLELLRAQKSDNKNLAVLMIWLAARRVHLEDYFRFYLDNGFDVLCVRTHAKQLVFPASKNGSQKVAGDVLSFLTAARNQSYENMMLHSFSIGGYQWGECLAIMRRDAEKYKGVEDKLKAQVYDSCVDVDGIPSGMPFALTRNKALRVVGTYAIWAYMGLAYPFATKHYRNSSNHFRYTPVVVPALYFNSVVDKVSCPRTDQDVVNGWRQRGVDVKMVTFSDTKHVQHLGKHPDMYTDELLGLMNRTMPKGGFNAHQVKADISSRMNVRNAV